MQKLLREPIAIEYDEDNRLSIVWTYAIIENINGKHKYYTVALNKKFLKLTGIRQAVFICKTETPGKFHLTTKEPPENATYKLEKPHSNKQHTKITLPRGIVKAKKGDKIKIRYYPREEDAYNTGGPKIELEVYEPERASQSTAKIIPQKDKGAKIEWETNKEEIPYDLTQFLTRKEEEQIKKMGNIKVTLDTQTNEIIMEE